MQSYLEQEVVQQSADEIIVDALRAAELVSKRELANEPACQAAKWFEYRFMSPLSATRLFAREYVSAYRLAWRTFKSGDDAEKKDPLRDLHNGPSDLVTSLWLARQTADLLGLPYGFMIRRFFENQMNLLYQRPPRPNQFYGVKALHRLVTYIVPQWEEQLFDLQPSARLPAYRIENYCGLPDQDAHHDYLLRLIRGSTNQLGRISDLCRDQRVSPSIKVRIALPHACYDDSTYPRVPDEPVILDTARSCFALHHASGKSDHCTSCLDRVECIAAAQIVAKWVTSSHGNDEPVDAERKRKGRERTRRHRGAKKLSSGASLPLI